MQQQEISDLSLAKFRSLDTASDATAVADEDFPWIFDVMPVGNGYLVPVPGPISIATGLSPARWLDFASLGGTAYAIHLDINGTMTQVKISDGTKTTISTGFASCQCVMWSDTALLIVDSSKGYCYWDGTTFTVSDSTIKGYTIAVHAGRVWIGNGRTLTFSSPGSYTDFTTASGGGSSTMNDSSLQGSMVALYARDSILYIVGNNSVNAIGDVTVPSGSTAPVFSNSNLQSVVGTPYLRGIAEMQRVIFLPSSSGVYGSYGVNAPHVSSQLDGIIYDFSAIGGQWHSGVGNIYNRLCYCLLVQLTHPNYTGPCIAVLWSGRWFLCQQGSKLSALCGAFYGGDQIVIGADSNGDIWHLFTDTSASVSARVDTKLFDFNEAIYDKEVIRAGVLAYWGAADDFKLSIVSDQNTETTAVSFSKSITFVGTGAITFTNSTGLTITFIGYGPGLVRSGFQLRGKHLGFSITWTSPMNHIRNFLIRVRKTTAW